ncbi:MAG: hypothetical protein U5N58_05675 [Actinomycetota bacterium]|nr:hypothetical protein [Actinomycetota bacterium]
MDATKMVFGIDILDYDHMDLKDSHKWLIETRFSTGELDEIANDLINKKGKFAKVSATALGSEMENLNCFRILEDLTGIIQHTSEYEI